MNKWVGMWNNNDGRVWQEEQTRFGLITPEDEISGKWTTFFNPTQFKGIPTLIGWIGGDEARALENQTDDEVINDVMKYLKKMFPGITPPDRVIVTRWGMKIRCLLPTVTSPGEGIMSLIQDIYNKRLDACALLLKQRGKYGMELLLGGGGPEKKKHKR